jgi:membrane protease YdiL (CAAX protease family)
MTAPGGGGGPAGPWPQQPWPGPPAPHQPWPARPYPPPGTWYPPAPGHPGYPYPPPGYGYPPPGYGYGYPPPGYGYGYPPPWYGYGPPPWSLPKPLPHDVPRPFLHVMRSRTWAWWKPLLGLLLLAATYTVSAILVVLLLLVLLLPAGRDLLPLLAQQRLDDPRVLLLTNASLVVAIPAVWLAWGAVHRMRIGWSSSVAGKLRWRLFPPWAGLALATIGAGIGISVGIDVALGTRLSGASPSFGWLLLVVILTTPLQSAAEEYLFRGYLSQAIAGWFRSERSGALVAAFVTATLFSLAHLPPDVPSFLDRFAVGLAASAVVWLTGGLEAAIALHAVNNVLVFVLAGALGEAVDGGGASGAGWADLALTVLAVAGYVALVALLRRRLRPETVTAAQDLRPGALPPPPDPSGMVSTWRREVPQRPWGMG